MTQELAISSNKSNAIAQNVIEWKLDDNGELVKDGTAEISVLSGGGPVTVERSMEVAATLRSMFPSDNMAGIISAITSAVLEERWSNDRLNYAVKRMYKHKFPTFTVGQFLDIDKKITLGYSKSDLIRKSKNKLSDADIVMIKIRDNEVGERRAYAYKYDAEEIMKERIVAYWDDTIHWWMFTGVKINDESIQSRQMQFKRDLFDFCDYPPTYNGSYPVDVVKAFYDKYSVVVEPGDKMLFETDHGFKIETRLWSYNQQQKQKQNGSTNV